MTGGLGLAGKVRAGLDYSDLAHLIHDAQTLEDGHIHGQQRLPDVEARMPFFLQERHAPTLFGQQRARRRSAGTAANDQYIAIEFAGFIG